MINYPRSRENHELTKPLNIGGHADFGSLTMLFEQNVLGLQMLSREGEWLWVKPVPGGITILMLERVCYIRLRVLVLFRLYLSELY